MILKQLLLGTSLCISGALFSQQVKTVYKIDGLRQRINKGDSTYIINFWATWCKPCVQELPGFDSLAAQISGKTKVLLVCLDFKEDLEQRVNPFLKKNAIRSECVLLDEVNGNDFVNRISPSWSGAIPATLFKKGEKETLIEKKINLAGLKSALFELERP